MHGFISSVLILLCLKDTPLLLLQTMVATIGFKGKLFRKI